jgi:hypothetical protein
MTVADAHERHEPQFGVVGRARKQSRRDQVEPIGADQRNELAAVLDRLEAHTSQ